MSKEQNLIRFEKNPANSHWLDSTYSIRNSPHASMIKKILDAALDAVDPYSATRRAICVEPSGFFLDGRSYNLNKFKRIFLVGVGKASYPMAVAIEEIVGRRLESGIIVTKEGYATPIWRRQEMTLQHTRVYEAGHPLPDERGVQATREIIHLLNSTGEGDLVFCLISGGGSALLTSPAPTVSLTDMQDLTNYMLRCGATINQLNVLRKHIDIIKGGGLAQLAAPATVVTLILSDVIGDPLDVIASGPTVPDISTFFDAWSILTQLNLLEKIPESIRRYLEGGMHGEIPETLKPGRSEFAHCQNVIIASNYHAASAAAECARNEGLNTLLLTSCLQGEAHVVGRIFASIARQIQLTQEPAAFPACIIAGGETTVVVSGQGKGGRNQEIALGSVEELGGLRDVMLVTFATDGGDGPTDAAGAVVTGESLIRAAKLGLDPQEFLQQNDAYTFFDTLGDLIRSGPTQTNVNDLTFLFAIQ